MSEEQLHFSADVSRLLDIVARSLYSNRDVFLRELISNASDACDKLRYESIQNNDLIKDDTDFRIHVFKDTKQRIVTVADNGIGMSKEDLIDNLGTIAKSGTANLMEQIGDAGSDKEKLNLIGQFGVGFYASFMMSHKVEVISRKAGDKQAWLWSSDGKTGYSVRPAEKYEAEQLMSERGTTIKLYITDDASDFLIDEKLKQVIETYSDHIDFPIYIGKKGDTDESGDPIKPVNSVSALWTRPKSEITEQQYEDFYRHIGHGLDEPVMTSHWKAEGMIEYTALLFLPTLRPMDLYDPKRSHAVRLYVKRVFITDNCEGLIYPWLRFTRGVIDSEDLPLNISREMLQDNPLVEKIKNGVATRILRDLGKLAQDDEPAFKTFWGQFGSVIKEGLYDAPAHRDGILNICHFSSTQSENDTTTLDGYVDRMKDKQDEIYYLSGENLETLQNSPQLEGFKARGIEVLFFIDTIDDFWLQSVLDYKGKVFKSVTKGDIDLLKFDTDKSENKKDDDKQADKEKNKAKDGTLDKLLSLIQETLEEDIGQVRFTNRLTESPVCLIAADAEVDLRMERVLKIHQKYDGQSKRILEINPDHSLIQTLSGKIEKDGADNEKTRTDIQDASYLLLDQARIIQGEPVPDPARFARNMSKFMERGIAA